MDNIRNLQNIPREKRIRKLFVPLPGDDLLIEADLSQAEGMVVAWYAKETTLMKLYRSGEDVHSFVGSIIMQKKISKKETPIERQASKTICHASNYGTSPQKITEILIRETDCRFIIDVGEAKKRQAIYFQNFPRIVSGFQKGIEQELLSNNRVLTTPSGFTRKFYSPWGHETLRAAYAHYPQNVVAWVTNCGVIKIHQETEFKDRIYTQTHDSICLSIKHHELSRAIQVLKTAMTKPINIKGEELVIPIEIKCGKSLGEMEEIRE